VTARPRIRTKALLALLARHKVSQGAVAKELGTSRQYVHVVVHGFTPIGPRAEKDFPVVIAKLTGLDPTIVRSKVFIYPKEGATRAT